MTNLYYRLHDAVLSMLSIAALPAQAQKFGIKGTRIDNAWKPLFRDNSLGTAVPNEKKSKTAPRLDALPLHSRAVFELANEQQGNGAILVKRVGRLVP